jgi:hypothetical protein
MISVKAWSIAVIAQSHATPRCPALHDSMGQYCITTSIRWNYIRGLKEPTRLPLEL